MIAGAESFLSLDFRFLFTFSVPWFDAEDVDIGEHKVAVMAVDGLVEGNLFLLKTRDILSWDVSGIDADDERLFGRRLMGSGSPGAVDSRIC